MVEPEAGELTALVGRLRRDALAIFRAALDASSPARLFASALTSDAARAFLSRPLHVLCVGKAAASLAAAVAAARSLEVVEEVAIGPGPRPALPATVEWLEGSHPVLDERSERAGRRALELASRVPAGHHLLLLLSGGASAMMAVPQEGLALADKRETTTRLLLAGAGIDDLNTVRKHLSAVKGGRLAAASRAPFLTLAISDVIGDDLSVIGSGPGVPDPSTWADALAVLARRGGLGAYPAAVVARIEAGARGAVPETPKPGDPRLARAAARVFASRETAASGAAAAARALGYETFAREAAVTGEARLAGPVLVEEGRAAFGRVVRPSCFLATGETTVVVTGRGRGGRNQEVALSAVGPLARGEAAETLLCGGTDGIDGPTDAAGALIDTTTGARAARAGLRAPREYLSNNDAYHFFEALGDLVITGPSGTNVGDLDILLAAPRA